jgi:outer membrane immunogenic protein
VKKFVFGMLAAVTMTGSAFAADMAVKARPMAPPPVVVYNWTGCFIGGAVGGGWHNTDTQRVSIGGIALAGDWGRGDASGLVGGGQIGCDYQTGNWVFGIQGQGLWADLNERHNQINGSFVGAGVGVLETKLDWIATVTGRIGYTVTPQTLLYVRGGGAWKRDRLTLFGPGAAFISETTDPTFNGWTVGGGIEYLITPNISIFAEANYADFQRKDVAFAAGPGLACPCDIVSHRQDVTTAIVGLNFRWGPTAAVVAKY